MVWSLHTPKMRAENADVFITHIADSWTYQPQQPCVVQLWTHRTDINEALTVIRFGHAFCSKCIICSKLFNLYLSRNFTIMIHIVEYEVSCLLWLWRANFKSEKITHHYIIYVFNISVGLDNIFNREPVIQTTNFKICCSQCSIKKMMIFPSILSSLCPLRF